MSRNSEKFNGNRDTLTTTQTIAAPTPPPPTILIENGNYDEGEGHYEKTPCADKNNTKTLTIGSTSNNNSTADSGTTYGEYENFFTRNLLLSDFWKKDHKINTIYENLCKNCGYGVFEAKGKLCNFCEFTLNGNFNDQENIYENICDKCGDIYDGKKCELCINSKVVADASVVVEKNKKYEFKKSKILSGIVGTLKKVRSRTINSHNNYSGGNKNKTRKLDIVHNVDGYDNVFRTRETFDLSRICELKRLQSNSDQHIYGKLRRSDDQLMNFVLKTNSIKLTTGNSKSDPTLHRVQSFTRSSPSTNNNSLKVNRTPFHDKRSTKPRSSVPQEHVIEWMTSLRYQTHDYIYLPDDSICNTKSIPSRNFSCCGLVHEVGSDILPVLSGENEEATLRSLLTSDLDCTQMVDNFKRHLMEKQRSKRKAIYLKIDEPTDTSRSSTIGSLNSTLLHSSSCRYGYCEKDSDFVSDLLNAFDSFLKRDANQNDRHPEVLFDNVIEVANCNHQPKEVPVPQITDTVPFSELSGDRASGTNISKSVVVIDPYVFVQNININDLITSISLSRSLHHIVLTYDKHLGKFLRAINTERFATCKFSQLLQIFQTIYSDSYLQLNSKRRRLKKASKNVRRAITSPTPLLPTAIPQASPLPPPIEPRHSSMTVVGTELKEEDNIYQPIWKFQTVGNPRESYVSESESDYYDITVHDSSPLSAEDHGEWETDDEFMFSRKIKENKAIAASSNDLECRSVSRSTLVSGSSRSLYGSSLSSSSSVNPYRNVCILYSVTEPALRAIIYDYDPQRSYLAATSTSRSEVRGGRVNRIDQQVQMPLKSPVPTRSRQSESHKNAIIPDCVQAWKFMLLHTFYADDEEDMYVSEDEILKLKQIENEVQSGATLQRFKSVSSDNLLDIPRDKNKSLSERFRNKLQRGVLKLNRSPKDKKGKNFNKRSDSTSLYLEDGVKPKYPIFGASLDEVEKDEINYTVPKFVVDCIEFIERRDCIQSDGLYRASGNKVAIDDLKKKLTESFVYDCKFLRNQDVHTITGLLKLFFRELQTPLIPNEFYQKLPDNLVNPLSLPAIKKILLSIPNPSKGTLQYLLRHLTTVAFYSSENRMPASNLAIIWGPCILFSASTNPLDIARMNTLTKVLVENYDVIFGDNERLVT